MLRILNPLSQNVDCVYVMDNNCRRGCDNNKKITINYHDSRCYYCLSEATYLMYYVFLFLIA